MTAPWVLVSDDADLAAECAHAAASLAIGTAPVVEPKHAMREALARLAGAGPVAVALSCDVPAADLAELAAARPQGQLPLLAIVGAAAARMSLNLASDLGIAAVDDVGPLAALMALVGAGAERPWAASVRGLAEVERRRLGHARDGDGAASGKLVRLDDHRLAWAKAHAAPIVLGSIRDAAVALAALRACADRSDAAAPPPLSPASRASALDVLFGPPRALSDPASKAALGPYGIPVPTEELCSSPSRAAAEAARIGFPVSIALASPDLRVWDHPDLAVDGVDNAARVREVFRQVVTLAEERTPGARVLGVTVTATTAARALLRLELAPLPHGLVRVEIGFADPHGVASGDRTVTVLPASEARVEHVLGRLAGAPLLFEGGSGERRATIHAIADVLGRLAAFTSDRRSEVATVEIDPLALLLGGSVEVREACVTVNDAFARSLGSKKT